MIETRKREHSRKPEEQYALIEACSPGPYLELFARHPQRGWSAWGAESSPEIQPRGRQHRGYEGGPIQMPLLEPHARLVGDDAQPVAYALRSKYENGHSIRELSEETSYSIARVRGLLRMAATPLRSRGGSR